MNCAERDRLKEILRIALHELTWVLEERTRIAGSPVLPKFDEVVRFAKQHLQEGASNYHHHIVTHGCVSRVEIKSFLKDELDEARTAHLIASAKFDAAVMNVPSGLPHPDGSLRIQQAGCATRKALDRYVTALRRFSDFVASGTVPEDLRPPKTLREVERG